MFRVALVALAAAVARAGHNDMFSCRGKGNCDVTEFSEANWAAKLGEEPHFVMFYAPWPCSPDIRGFPSLKYVRSGKNSAKTAIDYNGPREADDIERWTKEQFKKYGGALAEPVEPKGWKDLYTESEAPSWYGKLHAGLKAKDAGAAESPEKETVRLLKEAKAASKHRDVKEGIDDLLETIANAEQAAKSKGKPLFSAAYGFDGDTREAFNSSGLGAGAYNLFVAAVDRKNLGKSLVAPYAGNPIVAKRKKVDDVAAVEAFARRAPRRRDLQGRHGPPELPDFPKPASVLAAEERAAKKKAKASAVASIASEADLDAECYGAPSTKTCVRRGAAAEDLAPLAAKFAREGFQFASMAADAPVAAALLGDDAGAPPALVVVKGGKRPRAARAFGVDAFAGLLDSVVGGGATFAKFKDGLPQWPADAAAEEAAAEEEEGDEYDLKGVF
ncbi:hypothetical protein JL720_10727 [Aureococcus anophagefferens]|nr:hypothetical protein JL720_10727 [Aureococcus anophagefferens]